MCSKTSPFTTPAAATTAASRTSSPQSGCLPARRRRGRGCSRSAGGGGGGAEDLGGLGFSRPRGRLRVEERRASGRPGGSPLAERVQARDVPAQNQRVHVVRALVGLHR